MIAIVNIDPNVRATGEHLYEVRINNKPLFQFKHNREEPIQQLFKQAMEAAIWTEYKSIKELIEALDVPMKSIHIETRK